LPAGSCAATALPFPSGLRCSQEDWPATGMRRKYSMHQICCETAEPAKQKSKTYRNDADAVCQSYSCASWFLCSDSASISVRAPKFSGRLASCAHDVQRQQQQPDATA
jgi:hypothetical protein